MGADWALVRLDRPVTNHRPLELNVGEGVQVGTPLFVIGHPVGLPTKIAGGANVRKDTPDGYFVANLDTYGGNSGSAVFNAVTGKVEGILVRGEVDFVSTEPAKGAFSVPEENPAVKTCRVSKRCPNDGCRGEDVTKIAEVLSSLPKPAQAAVHPPAHAIGSATLSTLRQIAESGSAAAIFP